MTTEPASSALPPDATPPPAAAAPGAAPSGVPPAGAGAAPPARSPRLTRISAAWWATGAALLLLVLLIVFILQNLTRVDVHYLGLTGSVPLGMALLIAAVAGGLLVAVTGVARITQLRISARRARQRDAATSPDPTPSGDRTAEPGPPASGGTTAAPPS